MARSKIVLVVAAVLIMGGGAFAWFLLQEDNLSAAARQLPQAVREYRAAGLPWTAHDFRPPPPTHVDNAVPLIRQFENFKPEALKELDEAARAVIDNSRPEQLATLREALEKHQEYLQLARNAAASSQADFGHDRDEGPEMRVPELAFARTAGKLLAHSALLNLRDNKPAEAAADVRAIVQLADHVGSDPLLISMLVQISLRTMAWQRTEMGVTLARGRIKDLDRYIRLLSEQSRPPDLLHALEGDMYMSVAFVRNLDHYGGLTAGLQALEELQGGFTHTLRVDPTKLKRDGVPASIEGQAAMARVLQAWTRVRREMASLEDNEVEMGKALDRIAEEENAKEGPSYAISSVMFPVFSSAADSVLKERAQRLALLKLAEALRHEAQTGRFPDSLSELGEVPKDPFDGQPLRYIKDKRGIRVYSVGPDLIDNGGTGRSEIPGDRRGGTEGWDVTARYPHPKM
jgi:hypothetical protein